MIAVQFILILMSLQIMHKYKSSANFYVSANVMIIGTLVDQIVQNHQIYKHNKILIPVFFY